MKKIIFDLHPLAMFSLSCEAYSLYYKRKYNKEIFVYTRKKDKYIRVDNDRDKQKLRNRVMTLIDLGEVIDEIPFDSEIRVQPIDESYEEDEILQNIVEELGDSVNWKNSNLKIIEVEDCN
ncbi:hypothetical protein [Peptoniphilus catoniae]|uniref:hypothetical protein n=1 Tax=Peptoniphilus catoniae TaxID=1660341 RepID=UPI0010FD5694|nr:hypothetical protein [Peptoniphilus catoniae]